MNGLTSRGRDIIIIIHLPPPPSEHTLVFKHVQYLVAQMISLQQRRMRRNQYSDDDPQPYIKGLGSAVAAMPL